MFSKGVLVVALLFAGSGVATGQDEPVVRDHAAYERQQQLASVLNRAIRQVDRADRGCRLAGPFELDTTFTDDPPSDDMLSAFALLRRPRGAEETLPDSALLDHLPAQDVYRNHVRIARSSSGRRYLVVAARNTNWFKPRPARCATKLRKRANRLLRGRTAGFKRSVRRELERVIRDSYLGGPGATDPREGLFMFDYEPGAGGGGGGGVDVAWVRRHGMLMSSGGSRRGRGRSVVASLIPDGVSTVELIFPRVVSLGRIYEPRRSRARSIASSPCATT